MEFRKLKYSVIANPPYDKGAPITYWIKEEKKVFFGLFTSVKLIGNYTYDSTYGELGDCPFFSKKAAKKTIKIITSVWELKQ